MNLNQLYYFKKLAELQHFTKAAQELYITQPTLSGSISSLEEELGIKLFVKNGRNAKLTKYGKQFYHYVCASLNELEKGIDYVKKETGNIAGSIDIGCVPTLYNFLPKAINRFLKTLNAKTKFNIFTNVTSEIVQGIKSEKYDIGFCSFLENEPDLEFIPIISQEFILIVNVNHTLAKEKFVNLKDIHNYSLITYRDNLSIGKSVKKLLKPFGLRATYAFDDEVAIGGIVSSTDKVGIVAHTPYLLQFHNLKLIKLDMPSKFNAHIVYMCYGKKHYHTIPVKTFISYMIKKEKKL